MRPIGRVLAATMLVTVAFGAIAPAPGGAAIPDGFTDTAVANVERPTALAFTPDGRMLVTSQFGQVFVFRNGAAASLALDISGALCFGGERGLLGIAVDPEFPTHPWIYVFYTALDPNGQCPHRMDPGMNRVARFHLATDDVVSPSTEQILLDRIRSYNGNHNAGDLNFGPDGTLYVSTGDGGCDPDATLNCQDQNDVARDTHRSLAKILRINPDGTVPSDNPFAGNPDPCRLDGITTVGTHCPETFAWGFRNPFRMAFSPSGSLYVNDVGGGLREEVDNVFAGRDYGWNVREGICATGNAESCGDPPPAGMENPIFDYGRADGCTSITGGAFVPLASAWPAEYRGDYLFADHVCGKIFQLEQEGSAFTRLDFATGLGERSAVHLEWGPDDALYYTNYLGGGQIRKIAFTGTPPPGPTAPTQVPTGVSAVPTGGNGSARVSYSQIPAAGNGGSPVTKYRATCRASGRPDKFAEAQSPFPPITVAGMTNGVTYGCKVIAINAVGAGLESTGASVRVGAPSVPGNVANIKGNVTGSIKVTWAAATTPAPIKYTVTCVAPGSTKAVVVGDIRVAIVKGLDRTKTYLCGVKGTNQYGTGPEAKAPVGTTPR